MTHDLSTKAPRLYTPQTINSGETLTLSPEHAHYLKNVMRKNTGDILRLFNPKDGEFIAVLETLSKKSATACIDAQQRHPAPQKRSIHAIFPPIKKNRLDFLIEKAVELGATDLHPALTQNTDNRHLKPPRILAQIIEAAEQCERLDIPALHPIASLQDVIQTVLQSGPKPIFAAIERESCEQFNATTSSRMTDTDLAILIGPEGGFTDTEKKYLLENESIIGVNLGDNILRAETALIKMLSLIN